jgi:hypothetical protein
MNLLEVYLRNLNDYPKFKRKNKWADRLVVKFAGISLALLFIKIAAEFIVESL